MNFSRTDRIKSPPGGKRVWPTVPSAVRFWVCFVSRYIPDWLSGSRRIVTGYGVERFGFRKFILAVLFYQTGITAIYFTAQSIQVLMAAYVLGGIAFGVFMSGRASKYTEFKQKRLLTLDSRYLVRRRGLPSRYSRLPNDLGQLMLGHRPTHRYRGHQEHV